MRHLVIPFIVSSVAILVSRAGGADAPLKGPTVTTVVAPPAAAPNSHYPSNRAPVATSPLVKLPKGR